MKDSDYNDAVELAAPISVSQPWTMYELLSIINYNKYRLLNLPAFFDVAFKLASTESLASAVKIKYDHGKIRPFICKHIMCLIEAIYLNEIDDIFLILYLLCKPPHSLCSSFYRASGTHKSPGSNFRSTKYVYLGSI